MQKRRKFKGRFIATVLLTPALLAMTAASGAHPAAAAEADLIAVVSGQLGTIAMSRSQTLADIDFVANSAERSAAANSLPDARKIALAYEMGMAEVYTVNAIPVESWGIAVTPEPAVYYGGPSIATSPQCTTHSFRGKETVGLVVKETAWILEQSFSYCWSGGLVTGADASSRWIHVHPLMDCVSPPMDEVLPFGEDSPVDTPTVEAITTGKCSYNWGISVLGQTFGFIANATPWVRQTVSGTGARLATSAGY